MGFHISWVAVHGKSPEQVCSELNLQDTDEQSPYPETDVDALKLDSGWYLLHFNDPLPPELELAILGPLSMGAEVVKCVIEEASMVSMASYLYNGKEKWSIVHDSEQGLTHLDVSGDLPHCYEEIKNRLLAQLNADEDPCDYLFDVPAEVCKSITGFRHDDVREDEDSNPFAVMERSRQSKASAALTNNIESDITNSQSTKPWWRFW
ncbi:hypothetical protein [Methylophilus sp. Leaf414]|uniref:hypothetical protein n=1 Tax=Methylophilus sp. Leaf414 TaxID=1736371 RepID=UPI0006FB6981|nr:hypothetical protein [Methylophilus sp. Leaf414]KQT36004.1 hypothetical protein ASG24_06920 [Methylophilus sp. Leaf414]